MTKSVFTCQNCETPLIIDVHANVKDGWYEIKFCCPRCRLETDNVFIGPSQVSLFYPGDKQKPHGFVRETGQISTVYSEPALSTGRA